MCWRYGVLRELRVVVDFARFLQVKMDVMVRLFLGLGRDKESTLDFCALKLICSRTEHAQLAVSTVEILGRVRHISGLNRANCIAQVNSFICMH